MNTLPGTGGRIVDDAEQARRAIQGGTIADGTRGRMRRSLVIGPVADYATRRQAMNVLSERLRLLNSGSQRPQTMRTLKDFVQKDWEPVVLPTLKYATQKHYKYVLGAHLIPAFGEHRLFDISREAIQTLLLAKLREGYAWETVHHFRCALSKVLGSAEEWNYIADNPARKARLPRRDCKSERPILAPAQIRSLITALPEPAKSVAMLLVLTGLRIGELLALRW